METATAAYQSIPVNQIKPSSHQARKNFDEEAIKGLAESMRQEGLLQPVTVRQVGESYELISGERRLRAAKLLGWAAIDAKIIHTVSEGEAAAKGLVENLQRQDLNPIEESEGFQELSQLDSKYWTMEQIGSICGKGKSYVSESLNLLGLPEPVKEKVRTCELSRSHAEVLLRVTDPNKQITLSKDVIKNGWSVRETERQVKLLADKPAKAAKESAPSAPHAPSAPSDLAWKGEKIAVNRPFSPKEETKEAYLAWLSKAIDDLMGSAPSEAPVVEKLVQPVREAEQIK